MEDQFSARLSALIEKVTDKSRSQLPEELIKQIKCICKSSQGDLNHVYVLLMEQLKAQHAQVQHCTVLPTLPTLAENFTLLRDGADTAACADAVRPAV